MADAIDHDHTPEIVCPHCGEKQSDSWEHFTGQTESVDIECEMCERPFHVQQFVDISYTSSKPEDESEVEDDEHQAPDTEVEKGARVPGVRPH